MTTSTITATINGITFQGLTIEQAQALAGLAIATTPKAEAPKAKTGKAKAKVASVREKHDTILDSKRVERMVDTAMKRLASQGITVKSSKQGKWVWLYPCDKSSGQGRTVEFKQAKLAKGWNYSPKRGAFYRDFS